MLITDPDWAEPDTSSDQLYIVIDDFRAPYYDLMRGGDYGPTVPGYAITEADLDPLRHGHLEEPGRNMEWMYLIHPHPAAVEVYTPTGGGPWQLYSRHLLAASTNDLFVLDGGAVRCCGCGAVDEAEFTTRAAAAADTKPDAVIACTSCGRAETITAAFTRCTSA